MSGPLCNSDSYALATAYIYRYVRRRPGRIDLKELKGEKGFDASHGFFSWIYRIGGNSTRESRHHSGSLDIEAMNV